MVPAAAGAEYGFNGINIPRLLRGAGFLIALDGCLSLSWRWFEGRLDEVYSGLRGEVTIGVSVVYCQGRGLFRIHCCVGVAEQ